MYQYDLLIIGFGKAGKTLALDFAERGKRIALVERSNQMYGGTCINIGCIPTKTLVHQAQIAASKKDLPFEQKRQFYRDAIAIKASVVNDLRGKNYHKLADHPNITLYTGQGSFVSPHQVKVQTAEGEHLLSSDTIIINTGAETITPSIEGADRNPYVYTSTSMMELRELPRRLVVVGGGYVGLEFASIYVSFGSQVTVLETSSELLSREDRDIAASVRESMERQGVVFRMNAKVESIRSDEQTARTFYVDSLTGEKVELESEAVLLATGRRPNTEGLNLEAAGVAVDQRGAILVDDYLVTSVPHIRAVGDVKGGLQFTYISLDDYRIVRDDLLGKRGRSVRDREPVSYSVFIDPPLSRIGMSEQQAEQSGIDFEVKKVMVKAVPRAMTLGVSEGLMKAIVRKDTGAILGCTLFAPESSEIINIVALAMKANLNASVLRDFVFTHPSMSEALNDLFA